MSYAPHDCSTEDEGVDEDMMFEFEEELNTRLTLTDSDRAASRASGARSPLRDLSGGLEDRVRSPFPAFADRSSPTAEKLLPMRPQNPVAFVLESANDGEVEASPSRNGPTRTTFSSLSASPFCDHGSPTAAMHMAAMVGSLATPTAIAVTSDKSPSFDFNGRRKRKYSDDTCCVTPRVRPVPKRAKSFSCVGDMMLPDCGFKSISSTSFVPCVFESKPSAMAAGSIATGSPSTTRKTATASTQMFSMTSRSKSIQIPHRSGLAAHHRSSAFHHPRSSSGPARGTLATSSRLLDAPAASSDPLSRQASSSWNASVEYFCRRSLDISSPLRTRFRELVISSVGRAGGLKSP